MTDRQRWNWLHVYNAKMALLRLDRANTESVCGGTPFLTVGEKTAIELCIMRLKEIEAEVERGERSGPSTGIMLLGAVEEIHRPPVWKQTGDKVPE